jgi:hypothetical protein
LLYELLTGVLPISGEHFSELVGGHLVRPPRDFAETDPEGRVPNDLRAVVMKTLEKDPAKRFSSAAELARRLEPFRLPYHSPFDDGSEVVVTPAGAPPAPAALATRAVDERVQTAVTVRTARPPAGRREPPAAGETQAPGKSRRAVLLGVLAGAAVVVGGLVTVTRPAGELEPYRRGLAQAGQDRWLEAGKAFAAAAEIAGRERRELEPESGEPYLPHYFLGLAHFHLHSYRDAWEEWETSAKQGVIQTTPKHEELLVRRGDLLNSAISQAESLLANARDHAANVAPMADEDDDHYAWLREDAPDLAETARTLLERVEQVSRKLESAKDKGRFFEVNEAETEIRDVTKELLDLGDRILARLEPVESPQR